jgi:hypothetical protein
MEKIMTTYYKFLQNDNTGEYSGFDYSKYLPKGFSKGEWLPKVENIELCESGYHVCTVENILEWKNEKLYIVELRGKTEDGDSKTVGQQMRFIKKVKGWNEKNLRLAAADIVEKISLPIWKNYYPEDITLEMVISVVRRYANGKATDDELSAAWSAAESAAWSAAESAAWSAAESAAWSAAESAAWSAARSAALDIICKRCGIVR